MAKVQKTFRLDADIVEGVEELKLEGETDSSAYSRVLRAGLDALTAEDGADGYEVPQDGDGQGGGPSGMTDRERELYERQLDELRQQVEWLRSQCDAKDQQISKAAEQLDHAQQTTALATQSATRRRGLLGWLLGDRYSDNR